MEQNKCTGYPSIDKPWQKFYEGIPKQTRFTDTTPYQGIVLTVKDHPNEAAISYFGQTICFSELLRQIDAAAKALVHYGVKKGEYVTICSTTTPEVIFAFYAISKIGAVANVISPFYSPEEFLARVSECDSRIIMMVDKFLPKFKQLLGEQRSITTVILPLLNTAPMKILNSFRKLEGVSWKRFIHEGKQFADVETDPYEPNKPQAMVYSSGTTGASKGIVLSADSFQKLVNAYCNSRFDVSRNQTIYQNIPPWHSTGLSLGINLPLSFGMKVCTDPRFDHEIFIKNVLKFRPEYILTNTSMYQSFTMEKCLRLLKGKTLDFLKYPFEGGEPLTQKDVLNIENVFRKYGSSATLLNGYGECECGATITTDISGYHFSEGSSGIPLPDITTIGIFDDDHNELTYGQRGQVLAKTEIGMLYYYKNPTATEEFFWTDSEGNKWSQTGDIGYINKDGSLVVLGRKNDYSVIDGDQFYNFDIEHAVLTSEAVKLCEVQTHPDHSNALVAHIVWDNEIAQGLKHSPNKQIEYFHSVQKTVFHEMQNIKAVPKLFCIWDSFPSAHSGKRDVQLIKKSIRNIIEIPFSSEA